MKVLRLKAIVILVVAVCVLHIIATTGVLPLSYISANIGCFLENKSLKSVIH